MLWLGGWVGIRVTVILCVLFIMTISYSYSCESGIEGKELDFILEKIHPNSSKHTESCPGMKLPAGEKFARVGKESRHRCGRQ